MSKLDRVAVGHTITLVVEPTKYTRKFRVTKVSHSILPSSKITLVTDYIVLKPKTWWSYFSPEEYLIRDDDVEQLSTTKKKTHILVLKTVDTDSKLE